MANTRWWATLAVTCSFFWGGGLSAQGYSEPSSFLRLSFVAGDPLGELSHFVDRSYGAQLEGSWSMTEDRRLRLRADLGWMMYGYRRVLLCHPVGCRIGVDLTTTNNIFFGGLGPELALVTGAFEPYVFGTIGASYFATISRLSHADPYYAHLATTNFDDVVMAWKLGGGARLRLYEGSHPVSLDLGVEHHHNGITHFLTEGDIVDHPDGSISLFPNRSEANLLTFRVGLSIGFGSERLN